MVHMRVKYLQEAKSKGESEDMMRRAMRNARCAVSAGNDNRGRNEITRPKRNTEIRNIPYTDAQIGADKPQP